MHAKSYTTDRIRCKHENKNVFRRKLSANFTTVPNELFDHGLSLEAVGLLTYLLTRSHDWRVIPNQLRDKFGCGRDKIYRLLDELIAAGFVHRSHSRYGGCSYTVFDQPTDPLPEKPEQAIQEPLPEKPEVEPLPEKPLPEKPDALPNTERYQERTEKKKAPKTEGVRVRVREPDPEKPEQADPKELAPEALAPRPNPELDLFEAGKPQPAEVHMNGCHRQQAKEGRGHPRKEAGQQVDDAFERFWAVYPKLVGKLAARKAFDKALKIATAEKIIAGARRYASERHDQNEQYTKHPTTWLNAGGWMDAPGANRPHHEKTMAELTDEISRQIDEDNGLAPGTTELQRDFEHRRAGLRELYPAWMGKEGEEMLAKELAQLDKELAEGLARLAESSKCAADNAAPVNGFDLDLAPDEYTRH
jgi:hypothetical protein